MTYSTDPPTLTAFARKILRERFKAADMGISGANFAVAENGTICIVTNEGNGRFCTSRPRVLVTLMAWRRSCREMQDLTVFLKLLSKSATGQRMTCYTNLITGPRRPGDADGPEKFHLVILDYGRSGILGSKYREALRCIAAVRASTPARSTARSAGTPTKASTPARSGRSSPPAPLAGDVQAPAAGLQPVRGLLRSLPMRINLPKLLLALRDDILHEGWPR